MYLFVEKMRTEQGSRMPQKTLDGASGELPASPGGRTGVFTDPIRSILSGNERQRNQEFNTELGASSMGFLEAVSGRQVYFWRLPRCVFPGEEGAFRVGFF